MGIIIIQIVPKQPSNELLSNYVYKNYRVENVYLPSQAIEKFYREKENKKTKLMLLFPCSLIEDGSTNALAEKLGGSVFTIPSIGIYNNREYKGNYDQIVASIFSLIVKEFLQMKKSGEDLEEIIAEISRGHNIFVAALSDALRNFLVFKDLYSLDESKDRKITAKVSFSKPVLPPNPTRDAYIEIFEAYFQWKSFFSLPIEKVSKNEIINSLPSKLPGIDIRQFRKLIFSSIFVFSSIKNGIPLPLFYVELPTEDEVRNMIENMIDNFYRKVEENKFDAFDNFNYRLFIRTIQTLSLLIGMTRLIRKHVNLENLKEGNYVPFSELRNFEKVLEDIGETIASRFLSSELRKLELDEKYLEKEISQNGMEENILARRLGDPTRNFFAHAGFEKTMIDVEKVGVRYKDEVVKELTDCLYSERGRIFLWLTEDYLS